MEHKILLYGGGGHAKVVADALKRAGISIAFVFDDYAGAGSGKDESASGVYDPKRNPELKVIVSIGDNRARKRITNNVKHSFATAIDPSAIMSDSSSVKSGAMILQGAVIQAFSSIGKHVIVNTGVTVDHDCVIGDFVHIAPRAVLCGSVQVGEGAFVGAGTVIIPDKKIGKWSTIGAGAVVISDIPDYAVAVGNPARVIKYNSPANEHEGF